MICVKCGQNKDVDGFYKSKRHKEGETGICKECCKIDSRKHYSDNIEYYKRLSKSEKVKEYRQSENGKKIQRRYRQNHKEQIRRYKQEYRKTDKHKKQTKNQCKRLMRDNLNYKLSSFVRRRIWFELKRRGDRKEYKSIKYVGCTTSELINYIESLWQEGMSWDNYGYYGWHIDHIKPCASFNLTKEEERIKCFHYTNLQPLWAIDNFKKGAKLIA